MRAIEHGIQAFGKCSYFNKSESIYVFNEDIIIQDDIEQEFPENTLQYYEVEIRQSIFYKKDDGDTLEQFEIQYIENTNVNNYEKFENVLVKDEINNVLLPRTVYKINEKYFAEYTINLDEVVIIGKSRTKKTIKTPLMLVNEVLKEKKMAVVLFISSDGAKITRAFQEVTELYDNEIVLFIEVNDKNNYFGSVVKVKTGANINNLGIFPYKNIAKLASIFKSNVDESSLREILTDHIKNKDSEKIYLIKKTFLGLFDNVVIFTTTLPLKGLSYIATSIADGLGELLLEEKRWRYYDDKGNPSEKANLLLPGIEFFKKLRESDTVSKGLPSNNITGSALEILKKLKSILALKIKEQESKEGGDFLFSKTFLKIIKQINNVIDYFIDFLKNPLDKGINLLEIGFVAFNALVVGIINGLIEAIKGIFDLIVLISNALIDLQESATNVLSNITSYILLFVEFLENQIETFINIFSKENIKAFFSFILECIPLLINIPSIIINGASSISFSIDEVSYYTGYIIGMIIQLIIEILLTGGAASAERAGAALLKSFSEIFEGFFKLAGKAASKSAKLFDTILDLLKSLKDQSKKLKPFLDEILEFIKVLLGAIPKQLTEFFAKFDVVIKKVPQAKPLFTGIPVKIEEDVYALFKKGKEIFRGTKKEVEALAKKLDELGDEAGKKYLDNVIKRKNALAKWSSKFDNFFRHFNGEITVKKFSSRNNSPTLWLEGAHNYLVNGTKIVIGKIRKPPGINLDDIPNDVPFIANVEMKYANRYLPKQATSSFFPKNWSQDRIMEEVALVYDDLVTMSKNFSTPPFKYIKINSEGTFEILIEFDKLGNITSAYPNIKI